MSLATMKSQITELQQHVRALTMLKIEGFRRRSAGGGISFVSATRNTDPKWTQKTVVIVRAPVDGDRTLLVREARYRNLPPQPCTGDGDSATCFYEWLGPEFDVYPPLGVKPSAYSGDENTSPVTTPPKLTTKFYGLHREHDTWILDPPREAGGANLDIAFVSSFGGVQGAPVTTSKFIDVVRLKFDDEASFWTVKDGYDIFNRPKRTRVMCWWGTDSAYWNRWQTAEEVPGDFTPLIMLIQSEGIQWAFPTFAFNTHEPPTNVLAGDC